MSDFIELGLEAGDYLIDHHFDDIPEQILFPREALHNIRHRRQKHPKLDRIENRPPPGEKSPTAPNQQRRTSGDGSGEESDHQTNGEGTRDLGQRDGNSRREPRSDPYYREAERRTQNPRDYDPECPARDSSSPPYVQSRGHNEISYPTQQKSSSSTTISAARGLSNDSPGPRYDARYPDPAPNVDPYYPTQHRSSPSPTPTPPRPAPSITYAAAAYAPYPYATPSAAAAAFGAPRPYEYEYDPSSAPPPAPARRSRSSRRKDRPGVARRASSTGDAASTPRSGPDVLLDSGPDPRQRRPRPRRRASSTGDTSLVRNRNRSINRRRRSRSRDPSLPPHSSSKFSSSDRGLGASSVGALAGGFLAQEVGALMLRKSKSRARTRDGGAEVDPMVLTLLGAVVGGLGANLVVGRGEGRRGR